MTRVVAKLGSTSPTSRRSPRRVISLLYRIGEESIILVRGLDREVRAFFNVCRHRGSHLCLKERGNVRRSLTCPYHAWVYDLEGRLIRAARAWGRASTSPPSGCTPARCASPHGLIFICLAEPGDPEVADLDGIAGALDTCAALHRIAGHQGRTSRGLSDPMRNWKLVVDNFRECYHCTPAHPEYTMVNAYVRAQDRDPAGYDAPTRAWEQTDHGRWAIRWGRATATTAIGASRTATGASRSARASSRCPKTAGRSHRCWAASNTGTVRDGVHLRSPVLCLSMRDHLCMFRFTPISPEFSEVVVTWHVRADAEEGRDYDLARLKWMWDVTTIEDTRIIINNQKGVNSGRYRPGPHYAPAESYSAAFTRWYLERLAS